MLQEPGSWNPGKPFDQGMFIIIIKPQFKHIEEHDLSNSKMVYYRLLCYFSISYSVALIILRNIIFQVTIRL